MGYDSSYWQGLRAGESCGYRSGLEDGLAQGEVKLRAAEQDHSEQLVRSRAEIIQTRSDAQARLAQSRANSALQSNRWATYAKRMLAMTVRVQVREIERDGALAQVIAMHDFQNSPEHEGKNPAHHHFPGAAQISAAAFLSASMDEQAKAAGIELGHNHRDEEKVAAADAMLLHFSLDHDENMILPSAEDALPDEIRDELERLAGAG